ncbi:MAG: site-2 protease family protein [Polyangiaceae bacterium]|nr:site-2 protease family protein [Polyangiaceae bacterium]
MSLGLYLAKLRAMSTESERASSEAAPPVEETEAQASELRDGAGTSPLRWRTNLLLFVLTILSTLVTFALTSGIVPADASLSEQLRAGLGAWTYTVPLMAILLTHEFGHYFAARLHRVPASLPFFIPLPLLSPFGTMGAVIGMSGRIKSRNALLDIGAAGPLAGLIVAIPVIIYGLRTSPVQPIPEDGIQEGQSLLYMLLKYVALGPIPEGHDVFLNGPAFAGWVGLFVTMLNLVPIGQLDGGHIAYALFGEKQNRYARFVHLSMLGMFALNVLKFFPPAIRANESLADAFGNSMTWLVWFVLVYFLARLSGKEHPPTEPGELSPGRRAIAVVSLVVFVLIFMPTPWAKY